jgi:signal peptidase II
MEWRRGRWLYAQLLVILVVIGLDQWVKFAVAATHQVGAYTRWIPGLVGIAYLQNKGAAFGMLPDSFWLLVTVRCLASLAILCGLFIYRKKMGLLLGFSLALIVAGALGNVIDQITLGYVRDMFMFEFVEFAVFNVADAAISVGSALLVLSQLLPLRRRGDKQMI